MDTLNWKNKRSTDQKKSFDFKYGWKERFLFKDDNDQPFNILYIETLKMGLYYVLNKCPNGFTDYVRGKINHDNVNNSSIMLKKEVDKEASDMIDQLLNQMGIEDRRLAWVE